jgi:hypothetical protein
MSNPLQDQVTVWWNTVTSAETLGTYQKALQVTWAILRETAKLLWLFLCLGFVLFDWIGHQITRSSQNARAWWDSLAEPKVEHVGPALGQSLVAVGRSSTTTLVGQAREQLGLPAPTPSLPKSTPAPKPQSAVSIAAPAPVAADPVPAAEEEAN